ncbi:hypothetical protein ABT063_24575 [Streptomyces sp. NPDC002838]|uniref:hypothetical protein n=1 Tax=Streptomyces sp. NPDC002838 TaxID=3154436 RepID=UPI00332D39D3
MTTETIEPTVRPISAQSDAAEALVALISMFGHLPGGYIKIFQQFTSLPVDLGLQLDSPRDFEQWRAVLGITPSDVELCHDGVSGWLRAEGVFRGVGVKITGHGVVLPAKQNEQQAADEIAEVSA